MARQLGFETSAGLARWEDGIVNDHFANFVCDYLAHGYTVEPDRAALVGYVDLERAVGERIRMLERRRFEMMGDLDKGEWTARDHYKEFVVGVVADDRWLAKFGLEHVELCKRGWTARETTEKMIKFLDFLIKEWGEGAGDSSHREKTGQVQVLRG
ncbi:hypothetical protein N658DRAFT_566006 [Parathielavia hyrcaniae]|uniref:Uncharacterized protein n=1 Tax=Parathielavia hyrcaniae TaxID=113614 RepID=A0AAN6Q2R0_9PEZI|nr:hypothetical protein N658DRAFT_566006 [Parathielavia hyrcaniae]